MTQQKDEYNGLEALPSLALVWLSAFGRSVAIERSKTLEVIEISFDHLIVMHERGLLMTYQDQVIPVVDCRAVPELKNFKGATAVVACLSGKNFAMITDEYFEDINFGYSADFIAGEENEINAAIVGCIMRNGNPIFVLDLDLTFGDSIKVRTRA